MDELILREQEYLKQFGDIQTIAKERNVYTSQIYKLNTPENAKIYTKFFKDNFYDGKLITDLSKFFTGIIVYDSTNQTSLFQTWFHDFIEYNNLKNNCIRDGDKIQLGSRNKCIVKAKKGPLNKSVIKMVSDFKSAYHEYFIGTSIINEIRKFVSCVAGIYALMICGSPRVVGDLIQPCRGSEQIGYLIYEEINGMPYSDFVLKHQLNDNMIVLFLILRAILILDMNQVSHNDLHSGNIIIQKLDKPYKFNLKLNGTNYTLISEYNPVIIDWERSSFQSQDESYGIVDVGIAAHDDKHHPLYDLFDLLWTTRCVSCPPDLIPILNEWLEFFEWWSRPLSIKIQFYQERYGSVPTFDHNSDISIHRFLADKTEAERPMSDFIEYILGSGLTQGWLEYLNRENDSLDYLDIVDLNIEERSYLDELGINQNITDDQPEELKHLHKMFTIESKLGQMHAYIREQIRITNGSKLDMNDPSLIEMNYKTTLKHSLSQLNGILDSYTESPTEELAYKFNSLYDIVVDHTTLVDVDPQISEVWADINDKINLFQDQNG